MEAAKLEATPIKEISLEAASTCKMEGDVSMDAAKLEATPIKEISKGTPRGFMVRACVLRKIESEETRDGRPEKRTVLYLEDKTGKIRAVGRGEKVVERFEEVKESTVYEVSGVEVEHEKPDKHFPAFSKFYLSLTKETTIKPLMNVARPYHFVDIASLTNERDVRDVFGVITKVFDACGGRRDIVLMDSSNAVVVLTLWGEMVDFPVEVDSVLAVQLACITDYYGVNLGTYEGTYLEVVGPEHPEAAQAKELKEWYQRRDDDSAPPIEISFRFEERTREPLWP